MSPDLSWPPYNPSTISSTNEDIPRFPALTLPPQGKGSQSLPPLILGCAVFGSSIYLGKDDIGSDLPVRLVRLALRYGINGFDTSPYYHPSELILGQALLALRSEFPRESYKIITKAGKGTTDDGVMIHDLSPEAIEADVERSLKRFGTDWLDVVYLHDVEFNSSSPSPSQFPTNQISNLPSTFGTTPLGPGDSRILLAIQTLRQLKRQNKIRKIGIAGYPLPDLLRLALLVKNTTGEGLDVVQTYSHFNLQNSSLKEFLPLFREMAGVGEVTNASPLNMGLLTTSGPPGWHPARKNEELIDTMREVNEFLVEKGGGVKLEDLAVSFGMRPVIEETGARLPVVVGCGSLEQVHTAVGNYLKALGEEGRGESRELEEEVVGIIEKRGWKDWSWASP